MFLLHAQVVTQWNIPEKSGHVGQKRSRAGVLRNPTAVDNLAIRIIRDRIPEEELRAYLGQPFEDMVKFVVDVDLKVVALGGQLHADAEEVLLETGSRQEHLWGGNIYPDASAEERLEYTALTNIRPSQGNRTLLVQDESTRQAMKVIVEALIEMERR